MQEIREYFPQLERVFSAMSDCEWRDLSAIAELTGDPETSVSARLRDLRKDQFGALVVERRNTGARSHEYRVLL